jgi:hypothetical protein
MKLKYLGPLVVITAVFILGIKSAPSSAAPAAASIDPSWNHDYPRLANQHFGKSPPEWYALFDLIISKTNSDTIQATKALDPTTKILYTEGIIGPPPDKEHDIMHCDGWTDDLFARRDDGSVAQAGSPWAPRLGDMSSLPETPRNSLGERYNQYGPRCNTEFAVAGGYDGAGTDWVWHKPRAENIDMDRSCVANGGSRDPNSGQPCNDYEEHSSSWVDSTYVEGVSDFLTNWRDEVNSQFGDPNVPIWVNSGVLHDNSRIAGSLENTNGPEYEKKSGFRNFNYDWKQYLKWIKNGRKPTTWVSDIRPNGNDPYTYSREGHSKNYYELMRMMLAFTLMGDGYFEFQPIEAGEHKFYAYYDEFEVALGYPTDVGETGPHDDAHTLSNGIMIRFFDNGVAIMNPNSSPTSVSDADLEGLEGYAGPYWRFLGGQVPSHNNGGQFSSITLDGHGFSDQSVGDGILLVRSPMTIVSDIIIDNLNNYSSPASEGAVLQPGSAWTVSDDQGNSWSHRQAAWHDLYSYSTTSDSGATIEFRPTIGISGKYQIFEWHPDVGNACSSIATDLYINGKLHTSTSIDQSRRGGQWNSLGIFDIQDGETSFVKLTSPGGCTTVADAMNFVYLGEGEATTFVDVPSGHWAHDYIEVLYQDGYVSGCGTSPLMFCPDKAMTRAESAVFVERGIHGTGFLPVDPSNQIFDDVPMWEWFAKWASGLWEDGYTSGCGTDPLVYCPLQEHTRTEGTVFFLRMLHGNDYVPPDPAGIFSDVQVDYWGAKWAEAAYSAGLIPACQTEPELMFCPDDPLDRAMAAYMMVQAKGLNIP